MPIEEDVLTGCYELPITRHPNDHVPVSPEEYREAYGIAIKVYEWGKGIVEGHP